MLNYSLLTVPYSLFPSLLKMKTIIQKINQALAPVTAFVRLAPYLFKSSQDNELHLILRSYIQWMPLCFFSEPFLWTRMLLFSPYRFQREYQRPHSFYVPHLNALPFGMPDTITKFLKENLTTIREEFTQVAHLEIGTPSKALVSQGAWNTFPLMRAAKKLPENIEHCPKTWKVVQQCPLLHGMRGGVYFSIIYPGTHVRSHCGPSNLKRRYHLTIEEAEGARIRSGKEWRTWKDGECLILDDSFEHEVLHIGKKRRVVLIVDCWHSELNKKEREFLTHLHQIWRKTIT